MYSSHSNRLQMASFHRLMMKFILTGAVFLLCHMEEKKIAFWHRHRGEASWNVQNDRQWIWVAFHLTGIWKFYATIGPTKIESKVWLHCAAIAIYFKWSHFKRLLDLINSTQSNVKPFAQLTFCYLIVGRKKTARQLQLFDIGRDLCLRHWWWLFIYLSLSLNQLTTRVT